MPSQPRGLRKFSCKYTAALGLHVYGDLILGGKLGELQENETDGGSKKKDRISSEPVISNDPKFEKHWFRILKASLNKP